MNWPKPGPAIFDSGRDVHDFKHRGNWSIENGDVVIIKEYFGEIDFEDGCIMDRAWGIYGSGDNFMSYASAEFLHPILKKGEFTLAEAEIWEPKILERVEQKEETENLT